MSVFSFGVFKDSKGYFVRDEDGMETRQPDHATAKAVVHEIMRAAEYAATATSRREFNSFEN